VFQEDCPVRFGAASASPGALSTSAHARNIGNSVLIEENMLAKFDDQVVFTSTDPNATIATVSLNLDFATRLHSVNSAAARMEGSVLFGGLYLITVVLNSGNAPPGNFLHRRECFHQDQRHRRIHGFRTPTSNMCPSGRPKLWSR
jgi:hypothetical protein